MDINVISGRIVTIDTIEDRKYDAVVIGAGVAGLAFTLGLPESWRVALLTKGLLGESNTRYAQGGISAAIGKDDSPLLHEDDTIAAGAGLCDPSVVKELVGRAPDAVKWLLNIGTRFDRNKDTGKLQLGREAAHSRHRVLHAGGDATGAEIERSMVEAARTRPGVEVFDHAFGVDLIVHEARCTGLLAQLTSDGTYTCLFASYVVLAAGGAGQLWAVTSNPEGATADGLAMALRAGVTVADLEFVQFHPTVLAVPGTDPFLVTEAVRGEGAFLLNADGRRFMLDIHTLAELAPRDIVARGIQSAMAADESGNVYLDLRHLDDDAMYKRFPTIARELRARGLDLANDLIPVAPAAHYFIGGVVAATDGTTSLPGLLALGEASCTGVHGANRLASNSLLEGLVFGLEAATNVATRVQTGTFLINGSAALCPRHSDIRLKDELTKISALVDEIQTTMSKNVAVVRTGEGLTRAHAEIDSVIARLEELPASPRRMHEARNLAIAALAVIDAAKFRHESRGTHFRLDFDSPDPNLAGQHSLLEGGTRGTWRFGSLGEVLSGQSGSSPRLETSRA